MSQTVSFSRAGGRLVRHAARAGVVWRHLCDDVARDQDRLVLWLPVCLGAGILGFFGLRTEPPVWPAVVGVLLSGGALALVRRSRLLQGLAAAILAASLGFLSAELATRRMPAMPALPRRAALVSGRVVAIDRMPDGHRRATLDRIVVAEAPRPGLPAGAAVDSPRSLRIRLRLDDPAMPRPGDRVRIRALLRAPPPPDLPQGRDPQRDAFFSGLAGSGTALSPVAIRQAVPRDGGGLRDLRERIALRVQSVLPGPRGAVAATMLTGLGTAIPQNDRDAFAASGLAHLLAVAGLHLGIVMGLALSLVRIGLAASEWAALRLPCRQIAALAALAAGAGYMLLTGLHLPGLRSLAMATVAMLGLVIGRRAVSLRALAFAAGLVLLTTPAALLDVAYQMSFAAVLALLAGYEAVRPLVRGLHGPRVRDRLALHLFQLFFTSLVAGAASLPFAAFHFGRVQFYFVLANLAAVPLTAFWVLPQGVFSVLLMPFGLDWPFLRAMGAGIDLILFLARTVAAFPAASLPVPAPPSWGLALVSFGLVFLCLWRRWWRLAGLLPILAGLGSPWLVAQPDLLVSGDGRLIAIRNGATLLVEQSAHGDPITLSDWRRAWAASGAPVPLPPDGSPDGLVDPVCNPVACLVSRAGRSVLLLRDPDGGRRPAAAARKEDEDEEAPPDGLEPADCAGLALVVSPVPLRGACPGVPRIDRFSVWRNGPYAVWIGAGGVTLRSARDRRGSRLWVPGAAPAARPPPVLPMAATD